MRFKLSSTLGIIAIAAGVAPVSPAAAQASQPDRLQSAIVYNILRFVDFPSEDATLDLCVQRGSRNLAALSGKVVGNRPIAVRTIDPSNGVAGCNAVYLGSANAADLARVRQRGVLVLGDGSGVLRAGGAIALVTTGKQTRFEINMRAARQADVKISSQLLRLAARVEQ